MKIAIIGSGALGLYYGAMLQRAGQDVHYLMRRDYEAAGRCGLEIRSARGDFRLPKVQAHRDSESIGAADLVLVGLKTFSNALMVELCRPVIGEHTAILSLQNGLGNEELLAEAFGPEKVLGGVAFLCSNRGEPGVVLHLGEGAIRLGEYQGPLRERTKQIAGIFKDAGVPCEAVSDLRRTRWEKLVWNIPFNGLCALTGKTVTELLRHSPTRRLVQDIMAEVIAAFNALGPQSPMESEGFIDKMIRASEQMVDYRPSMMIDRQEGRPLELEAIYGIPLQKAQEAGADMIRVRMLHSLLELGELKS